VQRLGLGRARTRPPAVVDDAVDTARLERVENGLVHLGPIGLEPNRVVIEEHHQDGVEIACFRRQRGVELLVHPPDVQHHGLREPLVPRLRGKLVENEPRVLPPDLASVANDARQQLGRVSPPGGELRDPLARGDPEEGEHLGRVTLRIERPVGRITVGRGERVADGVGRRGEGGRVDARVRDGVRGERAGHRGGQRRLR